MPRLLLALLALMCTASACGMPAAGGADDAPPRMVTSVYPLAWIAQQLAPSAPLSSLAARGQDSHDLELSPRELQELTEADVVAYLGQIGFQPQVEQAVATAGGKVVDVAEILGEGSLRPIGGADDHAGDDHADDDHADVDAHVWFDARLMAQVPEGFAAAPAAADPAGAQEYRNAGQRVANELEEVAAEVDATLGDCRLDEVVVSHEAYGYLLAPHGLEQHGVSSAAAHAAASPQRIAALADMIRDEEIPAVLTEPVEGRSDAEAVAREAGVELVEIYSLDIVDGEQAERGYPALLLEQAQAVARAADCR